jgi:hypothetical protein
MTDEAEYRLDPKLAEYGTPTQARYLEAVNRLKSLRAAAREAGVNPATIRESLGYLEKRAARQGYAPGNWAAGVAPGYQMGKVTVQRGATGEVVQTWERQSPDQREVMEALRAAVLGMQEEIPRLAPLEPPAGLINERLANLYTLTDCHVGMLAWHREGGKNWDISISREVLFRCFEQMVLNSPPARVGIVNQLGDFLHSDGMMPVTPTSGHILDQDVRFSKMVKTAIILLRRVVDLALMKHEKVVVLMAEGNHDMASSVWLRHMFKMLYENEPRVEVIDSELPYYAYQHGQTMLGFHHGHLKKIDQFPLTFAAQFPVMWGATSKRYSHAGHRHHLETKEHGGMIVTQHPTLASRDAYAARGGWFAEQAATAVTYHDQFGQVGSVTITPEMLEGA